ncbi:hypothetical protein K466DRAFT_464726, partial [Polyporus arcularius HHB13444]
LRAFELSSQEWEILQQLRDLLKVFKDTTLFFSRGSPNITMVIPAMDLIDNTLTKAIRNENLDDAIRTAVGLVKRVLSKYYKLSDLSSMYRIALVMHPRHKLQYFECTGWPKAWIDEVV